LSPTRRRRAVAHVRRLLVVSERRAWRVLSQPRMTQRYEATRPDDEERLVARMRELAGKHPRYGYRRIWALLRREGWSINRKRVHRPWPSCGARRAEGLKVVRPRKRRRSRGPSENSCSVRKAESPNHVWTWDFTPHPSGHQQQQPATVRCQPQHRWRGWTRAAVPRGRGGGLRRRRATAARDAAARSGAGIARRSFTGRTLVGDDRWSSR
jgi:hypothetical protein